MARHVICLFVILQSLVLVFCDPPIDTPSRCANARKPANGSVKCRLDTGNIFDDVDTHSGGKSSGSGGSSKGPDIYTCTYSCNRGYKLNGPSILECPISKITDNPTCAPVECETLPTIKYGSLNCSQGFQFGSKCQYTCARGYNISAGRNSLTCGYDGLWSGAVPMCEPVRCPPLAEPSHGSLSCPNGRVFGSDCRYTCDDRYRLDGPSVVMCSADGKWSSENTPTCKLGECEPLPLLVNGSLTCTKGWDRGSLCYYSCHRGFSLTGGNFLLTCRSNGFWLGDIPTCEPGNSTATEFALYDTFEAGDGPPGEPSSIVGPGPGSSGTGGGNGSSGLGAPAIISIVAVVVILLGVVIGLFVAYNHKKRSQQGYGHL